MRTFFAILCFLTIVIYTPNELTDRIEVYTFTYEPVDMGIEIVEPESELDGPEGDVERFRQMSLEELLGLLEY